MKHSTPFALNVYAATRKIPYGKVATYLDIARAIGDPYAARAVGNALHNNPEMIEIPCHRVVSSQGKLSSNFGFDGPKKQKELLEMEGVEVKGYKVDLRKYRVKGFLIMTESDKAQILENARALVTEKLGNDTSGHDNHHIFRVTRLALHIANQIEEEVDLFLVELVALLHDVDDPKLNDSYEGIAEKFLHENHVPNELIKDILDMIHRVSFTSTKKGLLQTKLEGKIVQDADRLDAIGAIGIARTFAYGGFKRVPLEGDSPLTTLKHFDDKLLKIKYLLNLDVSKKIAEERHQYMIDFLQRYQDEIDLIR